LFIFEQMLLWRNINETYISKFVTIVWFVPPSVLLNSVWYMKAVELECFSCFVSWLQAGRLGLDPREGQAIFRWSLKISDDDAL
jgi:hypothetical protein